MLSNVYYMDAIMLVINTYFFSTPLILAPFSLVIIHVSFSYVIIDVVNLWFNFNSFLPCH